MEEKFEVTMYAMGKGQINFQAEVYYQSAVVIRLKLTSGEKEIKLEKRLLQKQSSWKVLSVNYELNNVSEHSTRNLFELFHVLDEKISGKARNEFRYPMERKGGWTETLP